MAKVLFEGTKTFWTTKAAADVTIVEHVGHDLLEVIAYDSTMRVEAPRVYLDLNCIMSFLDVQSGVLSSCGDARTSLLSTFVFNRLSMVQHIPAAKFFEITMKRLLRASEQEVGFCVTVAQPSDLTPYPVTRVSPHELSSKEMWRMPFILFRMLRGLPLKASDNAIYAKFSADKSHAQLVEAVAVVLGERLSDEREENLRRVAHAIVVPPLSPFPPPMSRGPSAHTLPPGFAESVKVLEESRKSFKHSTTPPLSPSHGGQESAQQKNCVTLRTMTSPRCRGSVASTAVSSPAGSRPSSATAKGHYVSPRAAALPGATSPVFLSGIFPAKTSTSAPILSALRWSLSGKRSTATVGAAGTSAVASAAVSASVKQQRGLACRSATIDADEDMNDQASLRTGNDMFSAIWSPRESQCQSDVATCRTVAAGSAGRRASRSPHRAACNVAATSAASANTAAATVTAAAATAGPNKVSSLSLFTRRSARTLPSEADISAAVGATGDHQPRGLTAKPTGFLGLFGTAPHQRVIPCGARTHMVRNEY